MSIRIGAPDVAGIYAALGRHDDARTARTARAMSEGRPYASIAWPAPRRRLNGRPAGSRSRPRTGRDHRTQPRDEEGKFGPFEAER
jgi:hypothetical protein